MLDLDPPLPPPAKPKLSPAERRARMHDRLTTLRLRVTIGRELEDRGITTPADIGAALGMPAAEAAKLARVVRAVALVGFRRGGPRPVSTPPCAASASAARMSRQRS